MRIVIACIALIVLAGCDPVPRVARLRRCKITEGLRKIYRQSDHRTRPAYVGLRLVSVYGGTIIQGKKCLGEPLELTKVEAESYLRDFSQKTGEEWRLPTQDEFDEILETSCDNPPLNPNVFPSIAVKNFWLSDKPWLQNARFACAIFLFQGSTSCRQAVELHQPILMVRD